jgi:hypothetical protein
MSEDLSTADRLILVVMAGLIGAWGAAGALDVSQRTEAGFSTDANHVITHLDPAGPAEVVNMRVGDEIIRIDSKLFDHQLDLAVRPNSILAGHDPATAVVFAHLFYGQDEALRPHFVFAVPRSRPADVLARLVLGRNVTRGPEAVDALGRASPANAGALHDYALLWAGLRPTQLRARTASWCKRSHPESEEKRCDRGPPGHHARSAASRIRSTRICSMISVGSSPSSTEVGSAR